MDKDMMVTALVGVVGAVVGGWVSRQIKSVEDGAKKGQQSVNSDQVRAIVKEAIGEQITRDDMRDTVRAEVKVLYDRRFEEIESDVAAVAEKMLAAVDKQDSRLHDVYRLLITSGKSNE